MSAREKPRRRKTLMERIDEMREWSFQEEVRVAVGKRMAREGFWRGLTFRRSLTPDEARARIAVVREEEAAKIIEREREAGRVPPVGLASQRPQTGDVLETGLMVDLLDLRDDEAVFAIGSRIVVQDLAGVAGSGTTIAAAQSALDASRSAYESDPARKGS